MISKLPDLIPAYKALQKVYLFMRQAVENTRSDFFVLNLDKELRFSISQAGVLVLGQQRVPGVTLSAQDRAFFNNRGGRIGIWTLAARHAFLDDYGGGNAAP